MDTPETSFFLDELRAGLWDVWLSPEMSQHSWVGLVHEGADGFTVSASGRGVETRTFDVRDAALDYLAATLLPIDTGVQQLVFTARDQQVVLDFIPNPDDAPPHSFVLRRGSDGPLREIPGLGSQSLLNVGKAAKQYGFDIVDIRVIGGSDDIPEDAHAELVPLLVRSFATDSRYLATVLLDHRESPFYARSLTLRNPLGEEFTIALHGRVSGLTPALMDEVVRPMFEDGHEMIGFKGWFQEKPPKRRWFGRLSN